MNDYNAKDKFDDNSDDSSDRSKSDNEFSHESASRGSKETMSVSILSPKVRLFIIPNSK